MEAVLIADVSIPAHIYRLRVPSVELVKEGHLMADDKGH